MFHPAQPLSAQAEISPEVVRLTIDELAGLYEAALDAYVRHVEPESEGLSDWSEYSEVLATNWGAPVRAPVDLTARMAEALSLVGDRWEIPVVSKRSYQRVALMMTIPRLMDDGRFSLLVLSGDIVTVSSYGRLVVERRDDGSWAGTMRPRTAPGGPG